MKRASIASAVLIVVASGAPAAQRLADLVAIAKPAGDVPAFGNDYVNVRYAILDTPRPSAVSPSRVQWWSTSASTEQAS